MKPHSVSVALVVVAAVAAGVTVVPLGHAQEIKAVNLSIPKLAAPGALDPAKRTLKLAAALKVAGVTKSPPQTLETRLTPVAPKLASGAQITRASTVLFNGSDGDLPDGALVLVRGSGWAISSVAMRVPTETGKLYVYDCRVRLVGGTKLVVGHGRSSSPATVEDGHVLGAFNASAASTELTLTVAPSPSDTGAVLAHFYGCDVGKAS